MNYRKLTASILIAICLVGTLSACGKEEAKTDKTNETTKTESNEDITASKDKKDEKKDKVNVTIDEIELLDFKVKEPDSIGTVYMELNLKIILNTLSHILTMNIKSMMKKHIYHLVIPYFLEK